MAYPAKRGRNRKIIRLREQGYSWRGIARKVGLHHVTVSRLYKRWQGRV